MKQIGYLGITNIPLYERTCSDCGKTINTTDESKKVYCLEFRPFPIRV